jgi:hypothetical protein
LGHTTVFMEEVARFLSPWQSAFTASTETSCLYFSDRQLIIHCISLGGDYSIDFFANLSEQRAASGVKIIHLWEDVWYAKKEIVQSRLRAALGDSQRIPARLTKVRRIDKPTLDAFIEANHLQVSTSAKYKYGLFLPKNYERILNKENPLIHPMIETLAHSSEILVAVASFSGGKNIVRDGQTYRSFELIRFANCLHCTVVGGLDKLLKAFTKELNPDDIMTYADRDWSDGGGYERLGFERIGTTPPQIFYVNPDTWERHYAERLKTSTPPPDWVKVYNAGNWKFLKKRLSL